MRKFHAVRKLAAPAMLVALLSGGCSLFETEPDQTPMRVAPAGTRQCSKQGGDICIVRITVNSCNDIGADNPEAWVPPDDKGDVVWRLSGRWKFAERGIEWKNHHRDFTNPRGFGTSEFRWANAHSVRNKKHKYTAFVTDGSQTCRWDPTIMN